MGGRELAQRLAEICPRLPVLLMSGHTRSMLGLHRSPAPGAVFLEKPFTPTTLARRVREILDQR
jgi:FixJ family two-component response regulator